VDTIWFMGEGNWEGGEASRSRGERVYGGKVLRVVHSSEQMPRALAL
ncbi:hypothetical protein Tco_1435980, partial [Tanacetum coccineum]